MKLKMHLIALYSMTLVACQAGINSGEVIATIQPELQQKSELFYKIREARGTEKPVLLILLHGFGSNEEDLFSMANFFPENYIIVSPQAPMNMGNNMYQWYTNERNKKNGFEGNQSDVSSSIAKLKLLVESLQEKYAILPERTVVAGFSQGANMSYQLGLHHPELMKGIGAWSGTIFDSLKEKMKKKQPGSLQIYIAHGDQDQVIPYSEAEKSKLWLDKQNYRSTLYTYKGMAHSVSKEAFHDFLVFVQSNMD